MKIAAWIFVNVWMRFRIGVDGFRFSYAESETASAEIWRPSMSLYCPRTLQPYVFAEMKRQCRKAL